MLVTSRAHLRRGRAWPCLLQWKSSSNAEFLVVVDWTALGLTPRDCWASPVPRTEPSTAGVGGLWSRVPEPELQRHLVPTLDTGKESDGQPSTSLSWGSSLKALVGGCARPLSPCSASLSVEEGH